MYEELIIEQEPMPSQVQDDEAGGCNAGGAVAVLFVIAMLIAFFVTIMKHK